MSENEKVELTNEEIDSFEINEKQEQEQEIEDPLETLVNLDFKEEIDVDEYAEIINLINVKNDQLKANEADEIVKKSGNKYLNTDYLIKLEETYANINNFYKTYDPNLDLIKNMSEKNKTKLFVIAKFLNSNYNSLVDNMEFSMELLRDEYVFLSTAIERKISYDGNEVFNIIDLNERYLLKWKEEFKKLPKNEKSFVIDIDIKNIVMLYHFLQKHTVKGLSSEFYSFSRLLQKIAETNKVYNAFNIKKERAKTNLLNWISATSPEDIIENSNESKVIPQ